MIRIRIEYDNISPFLRTMSGTLYVEEVDASYVDPPVNIFKCKISKETNVVGFSALEEDEGIPSALFKCIKPIIDTMVQSYWKGLTLAKDDFNWVSMEGDESWECLNQLEKEVGIHLAKKTQDGTEVEKV